jgi:cytochrome c oxidase assembly protein subunit 15
VLVFSGLLVLQILMGGFVAGLNAGFIYNTWPLMDGQWIPDQLFRMDPWWLNFFESTLTSQFTHRVLAYALLAAAVVVFVAARGATPALRRGAAVLLATVVAQALLGIWTLLAVVPVSLGTAHQGGAVVVLAATVFLLHETVRVRAAARAPSAAAGIDTQRPAGAVAAE